MPVSRASSCSSLSTRRPTPGQRSPFHTPPRTPFPSRSVYSRSLCSEASEISSGRGPHTAHLYRHAYRPPSRSGSSITSSSRLDERQTHPSSASVSARGSASYTQPWQPKCDTPREMPVDGLGKPACLSTPEPTAIAHLAGGTSKRQHLWLHDGCAGNKGLATTRSKKNFDYSPTMVDDVAEVAFNRTDMRSPSKFVDSFKEVYKDAAGVSSIEKALHPNTTLTRRMNLHAHNLQSSVFDMVCGGGSPRQTGIDPRCDLTAAGGGKAARDSKKIATRTHVSRRDNVGPHIFGVTYEAVSEGCSDEYGRCAGKRSADIYR